MDELWPATGTRREGPSSRVQVEDVKAFLELHQVDVLDYKIAVSHYFSYVDLREVACSRIGVYFWIVQEGL